MNLLRRQFLHLAACAGVLPAVSRLAHADDYPTRPIHFVIGFTPGAATDVTARLLGGSMGPMLGQQIVVENKPGGGSSIAAEYVAHAAKDGYTLYLSTVSVIINQIINPNANLHLERDLTPVARISSGAIVLVVNPESSIHNVADLIALAKSKPSEVLHATVMGSLPHLASELFAQRAGIKLTQVPYQGSPETVIDVMAGRALCTFSPASTVVGQIASGKLRPLATAANKRSAALPDTPTMAEAGIPDFDTSLWFAMWAPAGTPPAVIAKLSSTVQKATNQPDVIEKLHKLGFEPFDAGPDQLAAYIRSETVRWTEVARAAGLQKKS